MQLHFKVYEPIVYIFEKKSTNSTKINIYRTYIHME